MEWVEAEIQALKESGSYRPLRILQGSQEPRTVIDGRQVINLSSNNYLGLCSDPRLKEAAVRATKTLGAGSGSVRTIIGTMSLHDELEKRLAAFKHTEAAIVFQSGFTCNVGTIPVLVGEEDAIISDELNHASVVDGCRLSRSRILRYPHSDMDGLEQVLREARGKYRRLLVITDGVFSMDGDIAPLPDIVRLAAEYGAMTYVDDAHGSGVLGGGRGTAVHFGLQGKVDVQIGTLSKAVGVVGGYVAGSRSLVDLLVHRGRPFLFSTSAPPGVAAACIAALEILEQGSDLVDRLWQRTRYFKAGLQRLGFDTGSSETPIIPVIVGDEVKAHAFSARLFHLGVFAQSIGYPTVPHGKARVRTIVTSGHTEADLDEALQVFEAAGRATGLI